MNIPKTLIFAYLPLAVGLSAISLFVWSSVCPCDRSPGFLLLGESVTEPVKTGALQITLPSVSSKFGLD